ncbi:MAG: thiolase family protein [Zoogloeaceae bacterium]|jgi:acetyl-CoA acetyltransferases|nr:thiolase family protein [Zoogloeaceae bacterium]
MNNAVIVDAIRTPIGRIRGGLSAVRPDDLAAFVIGKLAERNHLDKSLVEEIILGCVNQSGEDSRNVARMAVLLADFPHSVAATTVNRLCASGLEAVNQSSRAILVGDGDCFIAGGVESMTRAPLVVAKGEGSFASGNRIAYDSSLGVRFPNPRLEAKKYHEAMGETAENVADKYGISRQDQDAFALESHRKAVSAIESGAFEREIVAVPVPQPKGEPKLIARDEGPRADTSLDRLQSLHPAFREGGSVTAGNSSTLNDGAAALLIMSEKRAKALGLKPLARILAHAGAGVDPRLMGIGPVPATQKALLRANLSLRDIDLIELNEAFAAQSLAVIRELGLTPEKVNVNGGAIALGHPLGCSGARTLTTLLHALRARGGRYGLVTLCVGMGQGLATIVENLEA